MNKQCNNCKKTFYKKITTSQTDWAKAKYCSTVCRKTGEHKLISDRMKIQNVARTGIMRFGGTAYSKQYLAKHQELVVKIKEDRKLKQKVIRSERSKILAEQRKLLNPKVLKADEEKRIWQKEYRKRNKIKFFDYNRIDKTKFKHYVSSAKKRNHEFSLTLEQFIEIFHSDCFYCGYKDCRGVDRVDNLIGYTLKNSTSCCTICNKMKIHYTKDFFINHCNKIITNLN